MTNHPHLRVVGKRLECTRCGALSPERDFWDFCRLCSTNLCDSCMADGCCGHVPAQSGFRAYDASDTDDRVR